MCRKFKLTVKLMARRGIATLELAMALPLLTLFLVAILSMGAAAIARSKAVVQVRYQAWRDRQEQENPNRGVTFDGPRAPIFMVADSAGTAAPVTLIPVWPNDLNDRRPEITMAQRVPKGLGGSSVLRLPEPPGNVIAGVRHANARQTVAVLPSLDLGQITATAGLSVVSGVWDYQAIGNSAFGFDMRWGGSLPILASRVVESGHSSPTPLRLPVLEALVQRSGNTLSVRFKNPMTGADCEQALNLMAGFAHDLQRWVRDVQSKFDGVRENANEVVKSIEKSKDPFRAFRNLVSSLLAIGTRMTETDGEIQERLTRLSALVQRVTPRDSAMGRLDAANISAVRSPLGSVMQWLDGLGPWDVKGLISSSGPLASLNTFTEFVVGVPVNFTDLASLSILIDVAGRLKRPPASREELQGLAGWAQGVRQSIESLGAALAKYNR